MSESNTIVAKGGCSGVYSYNVRVGADSLLWLAADCTGDCSSDLIFKCLTKIIPNKCVHVSMVYSSTDIKFYLNGKYSY